MSGDAAGAMSRMMLPREYYLSRFFHAFSGEVKLTDTVLDWSLTVNDTMAVSWYKGHGLSVSSTPSCALCYAACI